MRGKSIWRQLGSRTWVMAFLVTALAIQSLGTDTRDTHNPKSTRRAKLGDSLNRLRRDEKTGRLVAPSVDATAASYVEKASATVATDEDTISLDSNLFAFEVTVQDPASRRFVLNLKQDDFLFYDDEDQQPVTYYV